MDSLTFDFGPFGASPEGAPVIAGVVSSGNLEVLLEPQDLGGHLRFAVETSIEGFSATWRAVAADFANEHRIGNLLITVNDAGATPSVVALRLSQAMQELRR